jgi:transposase-like protein
MGTRKAGSYSKKIKEQIIKECIETNNYNAVARKHGVPSNTVYTWVKRNKNRDNIKKDKDIKSLEKELSEAKLENEILKELLKKPTNFGSKIRRCTQLCRKGLQCQESY